MALLFFLKWFTDGLIKNDCCPQEMYLKKIKIDIFISPFISILL